MSEVIKTGTFCQIIILAKSTYNIYKLLLIGCCAVVTSCKILVIALKNLLKFTKKNSQNNSSSKNSAGKKTTFTI